MVLPYHYKSFSLRLFISVALLNILGILVINSATYHDMAVVGRQMTGAAIGAITDMLWTTARAVARACPSKQSFIIAIERDTMPPPPKP